MKKFLLVYILAFSSLMWGANVYFDVPPTPASGSTVYCNQDGRAPISYHITTASSFFITDSYGAQMQYPDGHWGYWYDSQSGGWVFHQAGTYHLKGRIHVLYDMQGNNNYWMYSDFDYPIYVVDNYAPAAPQNLQSSQNQNNHPQLTWNASQELDFSCYKIYKIVNNDWQYLATSYTATYEDATESYPLHQSDARHTVYYRVTACDENTHESDPSSVLTVTVFGIDQNQKRLFHGSYTEPMDYSLLQNYPNPFNPSTTIRYNIKEAGLVRLEIYDILGNMMKVLVNEYRDIGSYDAIFYAGSLPSGIYFYKIRVNNFISIQKMQLIK
jgi:hypothetical protein